MKMMLNQDLSAATGATLLAGCFPYYQPLLHLPSGAIAGYEALARTRNARGEVVSAGAMFSDPSLSDDSKIGLDRRLRLGALQTFRSHPDAGFLSINISPGWISRLGADTVSPTLRLIDASGIDPARVVIEITESHGELDKLQRMVKQYHAAGVRVAIDDFGAENSQLDRVIALDPDLIKLDMRLFKLATQGGLGADVLFGMAALAERAGCEVVCEGVETAEEFMFGIECGAQYMQGWLFSQALAAPIAAGHFKTQLDELLSQYLQRKRERLSHSIDHSRAIKQQVIALANALQRGEAPQSLCHRQLRELGAMRYFICDGSGLQISPNYEINADSVAVQPQFLGYNWCWRPYFPMLMAVQCRSGTDIVASTAYRDASSGQLCKTLGVHLDQQRVLLVDTAVHDEVLHASATAARRGAAKNIG